ncbi:hypothetical protein KJ596_01345 [Patescibacteria group bacterium]|nr:hypothetical protein [Patescibacteria group bacterium]MBU1868830.1 hypothetical protein [Patescibacteria group bacterium]
MNARQKNIKPSKKQEETLKKNKSFLIFMVVLFSLGFLSVFQPLCYAATYHITNVDELQAMKNDLNGDYILDNDIDASETQTWNGGQGFLPIGGGAASKGTFHGSLDGKGHTIRNLYMRNTSTAAGRDFGLIGRNDGEIINVRLEDTNVAGYHSVGGLVGRNMGGRIDKCFVSGAVSNSTAYSNLIGGLVGSDSGGRISNSYSTARVSGGMGIGGLVGFSSSAGITTVIENCYAMGQVVGGHPVLAGGLVGGNGGSITNSYWDIQTSGWSTSKGGEGRTTAQMMQQATFVDWDFNTIWAIDEGTSYPYFGSGASFIDIGLRVYDGTEAVAIACEPEGTLTSPLRIAKNNDDDIMTTYGIALVDTGDPNETGIRIETSSGVKAPRKYE